MRGARKDVLFRSASSRRSARADEGFGKVTESVENLGRFDGMVFQAPLRFMRPSAFPRMMSPKPGSERMRCQ